jgi:hypothetical protein
MADMNLGVIGTRAVLKLTHTVITELDVASNALGAEGGAAVVQFLRGSMVLKVLNILKNDIGTENAQQLIEIKQARNMVTLCGLTGQETEIHLGGKKSGQGDVMVLGEDIQNNGATAVLVNLDLSETGITGTLDFDHHPVVLSDCCCALQRFHLLFRN